MRGVEHNGHEALPLLELVLQLHGEFRRSLEPFRVTLLQAGVSLYLRRHAAGRVSVSQRRCLMHYVRVILCAGGGVLVLALVGCTEWTISPCAGTPFKTPCVGPCTVAVEPGGPTYTRETMPLAVVIQDRQGTLHCQQIQP